MNDPKTPTTSIDVAAMGERPVGMPPALDPDYIAAVNAKHARQEEEYRLDQEERFGTELDDADIDQAAKAVAHSISEALDAIAAGPPVETHRKGCDCGHERCGRIDLIDNRPTNDGSKASMEAETESRKKSFTIVDKRKATEDVFVLADVQAQDAAAQAKPAPAPAPVDKRTAFLQSSAAEAFMAFHNDTDRFVATAREVYDFGLPLWCFQAIAPNTVLIIPVRKPAKTASGLIVGNESRKGTTGTNAIAYNVVALGAEVLVPGDQPYMKLEVGDVVVVRNQLIEPLDEELGIMTIGRMHVLAKVAISEA